MRMPYIQTAKLLPILLCAASSVPGQAFTPLTGRVVDNTQRSAPNLQVRLRPPQNSTLAGQIALTDGNGGFNFPRVQGGRYLLEVSQGPYLLYRQTITVPAAAMTITIQRH